jgi:hypothetical protein
VVVAKGWKSWGRWEKGSGGKNTELWWLHFTKRTSEYIVRIAVHCNFAVVADEVDSGERKGAANI